MKIHIEESWRRALHEEFEKPYFARLMQFVNAEYAAHTVYPPRGEMFRAFDMCPFCEVKVVILGQDPYHGAGQAHGLCFSVNEGVKIPPSLVNIFKEIERDVGLPFFVSGNLERWARQGVLLLNATLTVRAGEAGSHQKKGWEQFTDTVIQKISDEREGVVFMLWGSYAHKKAALINSEKHLILQAVHPSPLSVYRGFFGCGHFGTANEYLHRLGKSAVEW
jgi:uracil-DNA glycosylase